MRQLLQQQNVFKRRKKNISQYCVIISVFFFFQLYRANISMFSSTRAGETPAEIL